METASCRCRRCPRVIFVGVGVALSGHSVISMAQITGRNEYSSSTRLESAALAQNRHTLYPFDV